MTFQVGEWVRFETKNWPPGQRCISYTIGEEGGTDVTGIGLYTGRGKIISVRPNGYLIRSERNDELLVEVDKGDKVESIKHEQRPYTLGDLRKFMERHKDAPDDLPLVISMPTYFSCDESAPFRLPNDHPDLHEATEYQPASVLNVVFAAMDVGGGSSSADSYIPPEEWEEGEDWLFQIEIIPMDEDAHDILRDCDG